MGFSFFVLFLIDSNLQNIIFGVIHHSETKDLIPFMMYPLGLFFSIFFFFAKKPMSEDAKFLMLFFVIVANGAAGLIAGNMSYEKTSDILAIFPAWNMLLAATLMIFFRLGVINTDENIEDNGSNLLELIISLFTMAVLIIITKPLLGLHWAEAYSICIAYATSLNYRVYEVVVHLTHNKALKAQPSAARDAASGAP